MPVEEQCEKLRASAPDGSPGLVPALAESELPVIWRFLHRTAKDVSEGTFVYKENRLNVAIVSGEVTVSCPGKEGPCEDLSEVKTANGKTIWVCPNLAPLYDFIKLQHSRKMKVPRPVADTRKVGRFLYKLQPNQRGQNYWYVQFTDHGQSRLVYLGKNEPTFAPRADLERARRKRSRRKRLITVSAPNRA